MSSPDPTRTGKIARCPPEIRDEVCRRLHDGQPASKILPWLNAQPEVLRVLDEYFREEPVTPQNLSEWRAGGYADWLRRRERVAQIGQLATYAAKLGEAAGGSITDGSAAILGGRILEKLEDENADLGELAKALVPLRATELEARKARQRDRLLDQKERTLQLAEKQFQLRFCEKFIEWAEDKRALEIATGKAKKPVKMEQLRQLLFPQLAPLDPKPLNEP